MRIINLSNCFIYSPVVTKTDGEIIKKWKYKFTKKLNVQQDINELDKTPAGIIDYERIKIRYDKDVSIEKNDGISLEELKVKDNFTIDKPKYVVVSKTKVGRNITFICEVNQK